MDLVRGVTIADVHRPLDLASFVDQLAEALSALDEIHAAGFVIGAIDDGSVLVDDTGAVKLVGFAEADRSSSAEQRANDVAMLARVFVRAAVSSARDVGSDLRAAIALSEMGLPSAIVDILVGGAYGVYRSAAAMHEAWLECAVFEDVIDVTNDEDIELSDIDIDIDDEPTRHESGIVPAAAAAARVAAAS
jgi:hypothetical protein